jgi:glycine/D-amino acid oxidase-like deaminating enzyme
MQQLMSRNPLQVVVVGGGVVGLACAAAMLARDLALEVTTLEQGEVGKGATGFAGALDIPYYKNSFQRELVTASWSWHGARCDIASEYRRMIPMTWLVGEHSDLASKIVDSVVDQCAMPGGWRMPAATRAVGSRCYVIDPAQWVASLVREIESRRGRVIERAQVSTIEHLAAGRVVVRCADGSSHAADHVVLAVGPWLPGWEVRTRSWSSAMGLRTKRVFGMNVELPEGGPEHAIGSPELDVYFHPAPRSEGGTEYRLSIRYDEWDVDPAAEHRMAGPALERGLAFLDELLGRNRATIVGHRVFVDTYSPDFKAVVGPLAALGPQVTVATGTHGSGIRMAPGIAQLVATRVLNCLNEGGPS